MSEEEIKLYKRVRRAGKMCQSNDFSNPNISWYQSNQSIFHSYRSQSPIDRITPKCKKSKSGLKIDQDRINYFSSLQRKYTVQPIQQ